MSGDKDDQGLVLRVAALVLAFEERPVAEDADEFDLAEEERTG